jgi:hypothetical protein
VGESVSIGGPGIVSEAADGSVAELDSGMLCVINGVIDAAIEGIEDSMVISTISTEVERVDFVFERNPKSAGFDRFSKAETVADSGADVETARGAEDRHEEGSTRYAPHTESATG